MKVQITDLMDLYADTHDTLPPAALPEEAGRSAQDQSPAVLRQRKHRFGWREALSLAAALSLVVLGGLGVRQLLRRGAQSPLATAANLQSPETEVKATTQFEDVSWYCLEVLAGPEQEQISRLLTPYALEALAREPGWEEAFGADSCFALADSILREENMVNFTVYAALRHTWPEAEADALPALSLEEVEALLAERKLVKLQVGSARLTGEGDARSVAEYRASALEPADLSLQARINPLISEFARQGIQDSNQALRTEAQMADFIHRRDLLNREAILWQQEDGVLYETLKLADLNRGLGELMNRRLSPAEGTIYGDSAAAPDARASYHDGCFWWPSAEAPRSTRFALCSYAAKATSQWESDAVYAAFRVYDAAPMEDFVWADLISLSWEEAEALAEQGQLLRCEQGCAWLRETREGMRLNRCALLDEAHSPIDMENAPLPGSVWMAWLPDGASMRFLYLRSDGRVTCLEESAGERALEGYWSLSDDGELLLSLRESSASGLEGPVGAPSQPAPPAAYPISLRYACRARDNCLSLTQLSSEGLWEDSAGTELRFQSWDLTKVSESGLLPAESEEPGAETRDPDSGEDLPAESGENLATIDPEALSPEEYQALRRSNYSEDLSILLEPDPLFCISDITSEWRTETRDAQGRWLGRGLTLYGDGSLYYREGDLDPAHCRYMDGLWSLEQQTLKVRLWDSPYTPETRPADYRIREAEIPADALELRYSARIERFVLHLCQQSQAGFGSDPAGTELAFSVRWLSCGNDPAFGWRYASVNSKPLDFNIGEPVCVWDLAGLTELPASSEGRRLLDSHYEAIREADGSLRAPEESVVYTVTVFPDNLGGGSYVSRVDYSDPQRSYYGVSSASSGADFELKLWEAGFEIDRDPALPQGYHHAVLDGLHAELRPGLLSLYMEAPPAN